jgi:PAS domain S-box-containing protein
MNTLTSDEIAGILLKKNCRLISKLFASAAVMIGVTTLIGWLFGLERLTDWSGIGITMFPNTAVCTFLAGLAILATPYSNSAKVFFVVRLTALIIAFVGGATVFEHLTGYNLGIDTFLIERNWGARVAMAPLRMGPPASISILLLGTAIFASTFYRTRVIAVIIGTLTLLISCVSLIGFLYGIDHLFGIARYTAIALSTSLSIAFLSLSLLASINEHGMTGALCRNDPGGSIFRRLALPIVVLPLILGWLRLYGERLGLYEASFGTALRTLIEIVLFFTLLWWASKGTSKEAAAARLSDKALKDSENLFKALTSLAPVGIFQTDEKGNCTFVNKCWQDFSGLTLNEAKGLGWIKALHPDDKERVSKEWQKATETGSTFISEYRFRSPSGRITWLSGNGVPLILNNMTAGYIGTITDITARKEAEEALITADKRKDEFLATLAHELRNPLAPLRHALELMKRHIPENGMFSETRILMERQVNHLVRLVDDLLDVARITRNKLHLRKDTVELAPIIHQAVESFRPSIDEMKQDLEIKMPTSPFYLEGDPARLTQIFGNLIHNASKFSPVGSCISIIVEKENESIKVTIRDQGSGINAEMLPKVFEMFAQVNRSLEHNYGGLGIGLALVKRLVEMHDGYIEAKSRGLGKGSEFVIKFPISKSIPAALYKDVELFSPLSGRKVLVVDDNIDSAKLLTLLLEFDHNIVAIAHDGEEALKMADEFNPDIVILDIGLPKLNGYDVCREMRRNPRCCNKTIIALTGWGQEDDRRRSKEAGFDGHLTKPVEYEALLNLLSNLNNPEKNLPASSSQYV